MILSDRVQAKIIADLLDCQDVQVAPESLTEPWRTYYDWIMDGDEDETPQSHWYEFLQEFLGHRKKEEHSDSCNLIEEVRKGAEGYPTVDQILPELPELKWLWEKWIPRGLLTLLVAEPGLGKSYLALDIARRIIAGTEYPDGKPVGDPGKVLYVEAEHAPQIMKRRLQGWTRSELQRLFLMLPAPNKLMLDLNEYSDRDRLLDMTYQIRPDLVVIDSYGAVSLKDEKSKKDAQGLLSFLTRIAMDYECGMKMIHHPRKKSGVQLALPSIPMTIDAVRGTSYLVQIARLVLALDWIQTGPTLDRNGPRKLEVIKSNLDLYPKPIGVFLEPMEENPHVAQLRYGDAPTSSYKVTKLEQCAVWLVDTLTEEGPMSPATLVEWADDEGYKKNTVYRARNQLGASIIDTKGPYIEGNLWALVEGFGENM